MRVPDFRLCSATLIKLSSDSSGTSGFPKALGLSHYNLVSNALQLHALLADQFDAPIAKRGSANGSGPSKNFHIDVLPCFHAYGLQVQLVALMTATPRTVLGRFNLSIFLTEIEKRKASFSFLVPPIREFVAYKERVGEALTSLFSSASPGAGEAPRCREPRPLYSAKSGVWRSHSLPLPCQSGQGSIGRDDHRWLWHERNVSCRLLPEREGCG